MTPIYLETNRQEELRLSQLKQSREYKLDKVILVLTIITMIAFVLVKERV